MAKPKNPLHSFGAIGRLGKGLTFARRRRQDIVEKTPIPKDVKSLAQLSWRHMYQKAVALWHGLSASEQQDWESQARSRHMTGFAWFMSQALKPNPGLYLPLQGGTMQGLIQMNGHHIHGLPLPVHVQDAWRRQDFQDFTLPYLYKEEAKAYHNVDQAIPNATDFALAFRNERWDTDNIHDNAINNSRLTCRTAGTYLIIGNLRYSAHAAGDRVGMIRLNGVTLIGKVVLGMPSDHLWHGVLSTIYPLAVGEYVELVGHQTSGVGLIIKYSPRTTPEFMMQRIGP